MNLKKILFHMLTNVNEKSAYSSEIYLEKNSQMLSSNPLKFLTDLAKISFHYGVRNKNNAVKLSGKKESDFTNMYYRHKGVLVFNGLEKYKCIIIDAENTLFYSVLQNDELYKVVQKKNSTEGFFEERKKHDNSGLSINEIYEKINSSLGTNLTPEYELMIYEKNVLKNIYVSEIADMLAANHIKTIPVIRGCYPKEFYQRIFEDRKISFASDIVIALKDGSSYLRFLKELITKTEKENKISTAECTVYSSDYKNCVKPLRRLNYNSIYYYPPKMFYKKYEYSEMRDIKGKIYQNMVSYELFSYKSMKSREYSTIFAYFAPVITDILEKISEAGRENKIVFVGSTDNLIYRLYKKYYDREDKAASTDWSYFLAEYSDDNDIVDKQSKNYSEKWKDIYIKMSSFKYISRDRIEYSLSDKTKEIKEISEKDAVLKKYIKDNLDYCMAELKKSEDTQNNILLVDLTEKNSGGKSFVEAFGKIYPTVNIKYYSWYEELKNSVERQVAASDEIFDSIESVDRILQKDVPVIMKVTNEKISYVYPDISSITANEKMKGAIEKYIEKHLSVSVGEKSTEKFSEHDLNELLKQGNTWLYALGKEGI